MDPWLGELMQALHGVLAQVAEPNTVLQSILQQAVARAGAGRGVFVEVLPGGELEFRVLHHYSPEVVNDHGHYSRTVIAQCAETRQDILLDNAVADSRFADSRSVKKLRMISVLCMPILAGDQVVAVIHLEHNGVGRFTDEHRGLLRPLLDLAAPAVKALAAGREVLRERDRLAASEHQLREEVRENREAMARDWSFGRFVGRSPVVQELESMIRKAARSDFPVLLLGETGTGKSILARIVHAASPRAGQPFVTVFCPSLEKAMVEAELFGHRKGTFTGAVSDRLGKVQAADKGTLFLDEIGELPLEIQPKLLRLLQEKTYERLGDPSERSADVRVIAATNRDLEEEVRAGRFRRDLYERLNFVPVRVPPLRERTEDIPELLRHTLESSEAGRWVEFTPDATAYLQDLEFSWPGNVRHVEQLAARITLEELRRPVTAGDLRRLLDLRPAERLAPAGPSAPGQAPATMPTQESRAASGPELDVGLPKLLEEAERAWLEEALRRHPRLTRAELAAKLKISESALYKKLRVHGLGS